MKKITRYILVLIMVVMDIYYIISNLINSNFSRLATFLALFPVLLVPTIIEKILKKKFSEEFKLSYIIFIFLAEFLGSIVNLYSEIYWFDDLTHLLSGVISALIAQLIYQYNIRKDKSNFIKITYIFGFVFLIAGVWEIFEYGMDCFTSSNLQHAIETGVCDTMNDTIDALLGALLYIIYRFGISKKDRIKLFIK